MIEVEVMSNSNTEAVIAYVRERGVIYGKGMHSKETSPQGARLTQIRGAPIQTSSLTSVLSQLNTKGVLRNLPTDDCDWVFTEDYEAAIERMKAKKAREDNRHLSSLLKALVDGNSIDLEDDALLLDQLGRASLPNGNHREKREAGCRRRAEDGPFGGRAMFDGGIEWGARSASHSIEVRAHSKLVDNTVYNLLLLRNDIHSLRDNRRPDGSYAVVVLAHPEGLVLNVNSDDPQYMRMDGQVERIDGILYREEVQKRVIVGNWYRKIRQEYVPKSFEVWAAGVLGKNVRKLMPEELPPSMFK